MDRGEYVPDDLVVQMVMDRLDEPDAEQGFILDGFPRTVAQARALENALAAAGRRLSAVLNFNIDDDMAVRRLAARWTCPNCKRTYNMAFKPPANDSVCDIGGRRARASERRRRGHRAPAAGGLPGGDRAAGVLLLRSGGCSARSTPRPRRAR